MNDDILFSVIIPTYNRAGLITNTINSVLTQEYKNFELIVVDDGSTDNTGEVVNTINDHRLLYYKKNNEERAVARNFGVQKAKGDYVTFLDSDDILYPDHLQVAQRTVYICKTPEIFWLGYEIKSTYNQIIKRQVVYGDVNNKLMKGNFMSCMGVFLRKDIALKYHFNTDRALSGSEDWELWMRLAARYKIHHTKAVTGAIIDHQDRSVINIEKGALSKRIELLVKYLFEDTEVIKKYGKFKRLILANLWLYAALHLAISNYKRSATKYILNAFRKYPLIVFNKKIFAIIKNLL